MTERTWATLVILLGGSLLVFSRRYKNEDTTAGYGIAGWMVVVLLIIWRLTDV